MLSSSRVDTDLLAASACFLARRGRLCWKMSARDFASCHIHGINKQIETLFPTKLLAYRIKGYIKPLYSQCVSCMREDLHQEERRYLNHGWNCMIRVIYHNTNSHICYTVGITALIWELVRSFMRGVWISTWWWSCLSRESLPPLLSLQQLVQQTSQEVYQQPYFQQVSSLQLQTEPSLGSHQLVWLYSVPSYIHARTLTNTLINICIAILPNPLTTRLRTCLLQLILWSQRINDRPLKLTCSEPWFLLLSPSSSSSFSHPIIHMTQNYSY